MSGEGLLRDPALFYSHALETTLLEPSDCGSSLVSSQISQSNPTALSQDIPDRCSLFEEYCQLSECFYTAGGWARLELSDALFTERQEVKQEQGQEQGVGITDTLFTSLMIDMNSNNTTNSRISQSNVSAPSPTSQSTMTAPVLTAPSQTCCPPGRRKQTDVARAHLFWMLGKTGHGRTVRFQVQPSHFQHILSTTTNNSPSQSTLTT